MRWKLWKPTMLRLYASTKETICPRREASPNGGRVFLRSSASI
jgi:hypothetical protein